ncbi:MAG: alpha/beta hydrolase family protein [Candidatus Bruticola sp.]
MYNYFRNFLTCALSFCILSSAAAAEPDGGKAHENWSPLTPGPVIHMLSDSSPNTVAPDSAIKVNHLRPQQNIQIEEWTYPSGKLKVKGRLYLPPKEGPLPLVIFNHDGISGISKYHEQSSLRLASQGWAVFSPSYRGEDGSEGEIEIAKGEVDDVLSIFRLLRSRNDIDNRNIYFMGASHGALISLLAASRLQPDDIKGLIFAYGVADIYLWWDYLKKAGKLGSDPITRRTYGNGPQSRPLSFSIRHGLTAAEKLKIPVLILQGGQDDITPPEQGKALAEALEKNSVPCKFLQYPNCLHGFLVYAPYLKSGVTQAERQETEQAWQEVFNFLRQDSGK